VQTEARDRLRDYAPVRQLNVVRSLEEALIGPRVGDQFRAASGEFRAEIRELVAGQPQRMRRHLVIGPADHLEFQIGDDRLEGHRRGVHELPGAESARLFAPEPGEDHGPLEPRAFCQRLRQFQHGGRP
jgi:hypothetical protein